MNYKKLVVGCAGAGLLVASAGAAATERAYSVFVGLQTQSYSTEWNGYSGETDRFRGRGFGATGAFNDNWGARFLYYSTSHTDFDLDNKGFEVMGLWGGNLRREGFKGYVGAGYFSESWEAGGGSVDFSGWLLHVGAGYNWDRWTMDLSMSLRDGSDYESLMADVYGFGGWTVTPISLGLNVGYRF
ncbi:hypothetical protein HUS23_04410 [Ectothiorhodospiraceae bacterium 2226]|nr:hypothetical protein HUS23_04410 [Ectothiorhodospiraceae bacterium 2226]